MNDSLGTHAAKEYPVIVGYEPDEVARDEYKMQEASSPRDAARRALKDDFLKGHRYDAGTYTVTVLVNGDPEVFEVVAERTIETYIA